MNEVTTVATAYALAGFATDATHISSSNTSLAATGMANAFAAVTNLVNRQTGNALATTPNGNGTVPQAEIYTLASCVNTGGAVTASPATPCYTLINNAQSAGTSGTIPTDTATAAINIAHNPASAVSTLWNLQTTFTPFTGLGAPPADFMIRLAFTGGGITNFDGQPKGIAVDGSGNIWSAGYFGTVLSKFSNLGVPANTSGYALSLNSPVSVAIDANSTHVWIAEFGTGSGDGGTESFNISTSTGTAYGSGGNANTGVFGISLDGSGNVWVSNYDSNSVTSNVVKMTTGGTVSKTITNSKMESPTIIAFEPGAIGNTWVADEDSTGAVLISNAGSYLSSDTQGSQNDAQDVAVDSGGYAWFTNLFSLNLSKVNGAGTSGTSIPISTVGSDFPYIDGLAIDGAGNVWVTSNSSNTGFTVSAADNAVFEYNNAGTAIGPTHGYAASPTTLCPGAVVIDGSGNVWYQTNVVDGQNAAYAAATLVEMVGAGVPVATPLAYAVTNSMLGTRP
jgi:hypothetical protein